MTRTALFSAGILAAFALPAAAQPVTLAPPVVPLYRPAITSACQTTEQFPDAAKLVTIGPHGRIATTRLGGGDSVSTTRVCQAG